MKEKPFCPVSRMNKAGTVRTGKPLQGGGRGDKRKEQTDEV